MPKTKGIRAGKRKKGGKKIVDPFTKKDWFDVKAPNIFTNRDIGKTLVTRSSGKRIAADFLMGRVFEVSLADLNKDEERAFRKFTFSVDAVRGNNCLTNFHGMSFTTDKMRSLVRKWQTKIEAHVNVKTSDGYTLRLFCMGFTKRKPNQNRKTSYAKSSQIRAIRKKMVDIMVRESSNCDLKDLITKFIPEVIGRQVVKECSGIYPLQNVFVRKAKVLKRPKRDMGKLMELHTEKEEDKGSKV